MLTNKHSLLDIKCVVTFRVFWGTQKCNFIVTVIDFSKEMVRLVKEKAPTGTSSDYEPEKVAFSTTS